MTYCFRHRLCGWHQARPPRQKETAC